MGWRWLEGSAFSKRENSKNWNLIETNRNCAQFIIFFIALHMHSSHSIWLISDKLGQIKMLENTRFHRENSSETVPVHHHLLINRVYSATLNIITHYHNVVLNKANWKDFQFTLGVNERTPSNKFRNKALIQFTPFLVCTSTWTHGHHRIEIVIIFFFHSVQHLTSHTMATMLLMWKSSSAAIFFSRCTMCSDAIYV